MAKEVLTVCCSGCFVALAAWVAWGIVLIVRGLRDAPLVVEE